MASTSSVCVNEYDEPDAPAGREHRVRDAFVHRVEQLVLGAGAGRARHVDVEHAPDHRRRRENASRAPRQLLETPLHQAGHCSRQLDVVLRLQLPPAVREAGASGRRTACAGSAS